MVNIRIGSGNGRVIVHAVNVDHQPGLGRGPLRVCRAQRGRDDGVLISTQTVDTRIIRLKAVSATRLHRQRAQFHTIQRGFGHDRVADTIKVEGLRCGTFCNLLPCNRIHHRVDMPAVAVCGRQSPPLCCTLIRSGCVGDVDGIDCGQFRRVIGRGDIHRQRRGIERTVLIRHNNREGLIRFGICGQPLQLCRIRRVSIAAIRQDRQRPILTL